MDRFKVGVWTTCIGAVIILDTVAIIFGLLEELLVLGIFLLLFGFIMLSN